LGPLQTLRRHWPEYLMEAWGLGVFMVAAGMAVVLLESAGSPVHQWIGDADLRRVLIGIVMGLTAIGIIYSPWGQQSGAHINPAVTLAFLRLGKIAPWDAVFYIAAQFIGGTLGVLLALLLLGDSFALAPVAYVVTVPGRGGVAPAFWAELLISFGLMLTVLIFLNTQRLQRYTGFAAGALVAIYIAIEAPLSGMSINPARTFASALPADQWHAWWVYFTAPILGMLLAVEIHRALKFGSALMCAKLDHSAHRRCIHCGYEPGRANNRQDKS
jgi:aquaporin Z